VTIALRAPAAWLGDWLQRHGKVPPARCARHRLARLGAARHQQRPRDHAHSGRIEWTVDALAPTRIAARVSHRWLGAPLALSVANDGMQIARAARGCRRCLAGTGAPFNTLRPGGLLEASWTDSRIRGGVLTGEVQVDWRDAQSALSTVAPLGTYRLKLRGTGGYPPWTSPPGGPLQKQGTGTMEGSRIVQRDATVEPAMQGPSTAARAPGHASGDKVLLAVDT